MIEIRRAVSSDLDDVLPLIAEFYEADAHSFDLSRVQAGLRPLLADDAVGQVWVAQDTMGAVSLVGYAVVTWSWSLESGGRDCLLDEIYVRLRGEGIGGRLLHHAMTEAQVAGCASMFMETEAPNDQARAFYARHGFSVEDSVWMGRDLVDGA
ncbi:GNAT family N-acetyltransferase [Streptomyces sp. NPDC047108]|uniref:GNAT family N-acetyltransferase n=1 Tax=Streptomyces sp. NPDC047108 TaxID=3155025 RepID=UPI00340223D4